MEQMFIEMNSEAEMTEVIHERIESCWFRFSIPVAWDFALHRTASDYSN